MKKFTYISMILAIAGAIFSGALLLQHYYPEANLGLLSCGTGLENPCIIVSQSDASKLFGIPLAAFGLLFYLFFLFVVLIADYAQKEYNELGVYMLLPLTGAAVIIDLLLAGLLIKMGEFCTLCFYTYLINIALLVVMILWFRKLRSESSESLKNRLKTILKIDDSESHKKAAFSSFSLFVILLVFAVFSTNTIMTFKSGGAHIPHQQIKKFLDNFYKEKPVEIALPESPYVLGAENAPLTISVFTDYLCSACYAFYKVEKFLLSKYKGKIKIIYYHYPLDSNCNSDVSRTIYKNSCTASRAMHAAANKDIFTSYIVQHFSRYKSLKKEYSEEWSAEILSDLKKQNLAKDITENSFKEIMFSEDATQTINSHVEAAVALKIDATPTIIINGRKLVGVPPKEMMSALIDNELKK